jgi:tetratricopeptide (TPR) repeat protein
MKLEIGNSKSVLRIIFLLFFAVNFSFAKGPQEQYYQANEYYKKADYENAIKTYEQLIKEGNASADVYYNLGNTYYKTGNVAKSILNYERALKLNPDDEDATFNLHIAQLKVADRIEPLPEIFYMRWIHSLAASMPVSTWTMIFIAAFWLLFVSAAWYVFSVSSVMKRISFGLIVLFMILSVSTFALARQSHIQQEENKEAVVSAPSIYVKSSPDEKGNDLFILHEGTIVNILDELGGWKKIRIANGTIGWLKGKDIEEI